MKRAALLLGAAVAAVLCVATWPVVEARTALVRRRLRKEAGVRPGSQEGWIG